METLYRRAPQGARGLKYKKLKITSAKRQSRPARGAWVEISYEQSLDVWHLGRAPQGARGLKFLWTPVTDGAGRSRPARGAWVEIFVNRLKGQPQERRAPQGARGLKSPLCLRPTAPP